jgi:hypothetical protein
VQEAVAVAGRHDGYFCSYCLKDLIQWMLDAFASLLNKT